MSTAIIIILTLVVVAVVVAGVLYTVRGQGGGRGLRQRFGPEYDRVLARHDGDTQATDRELKERVRKHGSLVLMPLTPETAEGYAAGWRAAQERFVESPQQAVREADGLLARLAADRGFPPAQDHDQQFDALSVHHSQHVHGYRLVHAAALGESNTEQMREAFVGSRALFEALLEDRPAQPDRSGRSVRGGRVNPTWGRQPTKRGEKI